MIAPPEMTIVATANETEQKIVLEPHTREQVLAWATSLSGRAVAGTPTETVAKWDENPDDMWELLTIRRPDALRWGITIPATAERPEKRIGFVSLGHAIGGNENDDRPTAAGLRAGKRFANMNTIGLFIADDESVGRGYGALAGAALLKHAFYETDAIAMGASVPSSCTASRRLLEKGGFTNLGTSDVPMNFGREGREERSEYWHLTDDPTFLPDTTLEQGYELAEGWHRFLHATANIKVTYPNLMPDA